MCHISMYKGVPWSVNLKNLYRAYIGIGRYIVNAFDDLLWLHGFDDYGTCSGILN